jgi:hypothetical protein
MLLSVPCSALRSSFAVSVSERLIIILCLESFASASGSDSSESMMAVDFLVLGFEGAGFASAALVSFDVFEDIGFELEGRFCFI